MEPKAKTKGRKGRAKPRKVTRGIDSRVKVALIGVVLVAVVVWLVFLIKPAQQNQLGQPPVTASFDNLIGQQAPDFALESYDGRKFVLSQLKGKTVVLFFSEGVMCYPACWDQIVAFGEDRRLNNESVVTLTIVNDKKDEWKQAVDEMPELGRAIVLLDTDRSVSRTYGVLSLPSSMHRGQLPGHTYLIVDSKGVIRYTKDDVQMAIRNGELVSAIAKLS